MARYNVYAAAGHKVAEIELRDPNDRMDLYNILKGFGMANHNVALYGDEDGWYVEDVYTYEGLYEVKPV